MKCGAVRRRVEGGQIVLALVALLGGTLLAGCATTATPTTTGGPAPRTTARAVQHPTLEGIPLPAGFQLVENHSFAVLSGQLRHANCEFLGSMEPAAVCRFYEEYMPSSGFRLRQKRFDRGEYVLEFDGDAERSTVRIRRDRFKTVLVIDVSPTPKGPVEREPKRPTQRP